MQGVIADSIGLRLEEESIVGRAAKLMEVLNEKTREADASKGEIKKAEKILIILDNLWVKISLEEVGIPTGAKELKLLLTARDQDLLTSKMNLGITFPVESLSGTDAWTLFQTLAPICIHRPNLTGIAKKVAYKCGGMPIAINAVAQALKKKESRDYWKNAWDRLNNPSPESIEGMMKEVYESILLSFNFLSPHLQKIFLLCSRMTHTYNCAIRDLFRYGLGLGYLANFRTLDEGLSYVYSSVKELKAASLLVDPPESFNSTPASESFGIHDVICYFARSKASKDLHVTGPSHDIRLESLFI